MFELYSAQIFLCAFAMVVMCSCIQANALLSRSQKRCFYGLYLLVIVASIAEWAGVFLQNCSLNTRILHIIIKTFELGITPYIGVYAMVLLSERDKAKILLYPLGVHLLLEILSAFFGFIFYVDASNVYHHGSFYFIYMATYGISIFFCVISVLKNIKRYRYNGGFFMIFMAIFLIVGVGVSVIFSSIKVSWLVLDIVGIMIYIFYSDMVTQVDALTGILNRRAYESYIARIQKRVIFIEFDVDRFKSINDTYGHDVGDRCLKAVSQTLQETFSYIGLCFRTGGDEFIVALESYKGSLDTITSEFVGLLEEKRAKDPVIPRVSMGFGIYNPGKNSIFDAIKEADEMMYSFKEMNR